MFFLSKSYVVYSGNSHNHLQSNLITKVGTEVTFLPTNENYFGAKQAACVHCFVFGM